MDVTRLWEMNFSFPYLNAPTKTEVILQTPYLHPNITLQSLMKAKGFENTKQKGPYKDHFNDT